MRLAHTSHALDVSRNPCDNRVALRHWAVAINPTGITIMAKQATSNAVWTQIDTDSLPEDIAKAYADYKATYAEMKMMRERFEKSLASKLAVPAGKRAVFGYNFGKLSIAIVDDTAPKAKATSAVSLASLIRR